MLRRVSHREAYVGKRWIDAAIEGARSEERIGETREYEPCQLIVRSRTRARSPMQQEWRLCALEWDGTSRAAGDGWHTPLPFRNFSVHLARCGSTTN